MIAAFLLVHITVQSEGSGHYADTHKVRFSDRYNHRTFTDNAPLPLESKTVGHALFIMYFSQLIIGLIIHYIKPSRPRHRPLQNYFHGLFGVAILITGFYEARTGYRTEWPNRVGTHVPKIVGAAWYGVVIGNSLPYLIGLVMLRAQYRDERATREKWITDQREKAVATP
jgi:TctA family transporter